MDERRTAARGRRSPRYAMRVLRHAAEGLCSSSVHCWGAAETGGITSVLALPTLARGLARSTASTKVLLPSTPHAGRWRFEGDGVFTLVVGAAVEGGSGDDGVVGPRIVEGGGGDVEGSRPGIRGAIRFLTRVELGRFVPRVGMLAVWGAVCGAHRTVWMGG